MITLLVWLAVVYEQLAGCTGMSQQVESSISVPAPIPSVRALQTSPEVGSVQGSKVHCAEYLVGTDSCVPFLP